MLDAISGLFSGSALGVLVKTSGAALTLLVVVPALMKLFLVTIDEGSTARQRMIAALAGVRHKLESAEAGGGNTAERVVGLAAELLGERAA